MSYDVGMAVDTGGKYPAGVGQSYNYTYNCGPMFRAAFGGDGLYELRGVTGEKAADMIRAAMIYFRQHMDEMRAMNPPNGWGDADSALEFLGNVLEQALEHPKAFVEVT